MLEDLGTEEARHSGTKERHAQKVAIGICRAVMIAVFWVLSSNAAEPAATDSWPTYHGGADLCGVATCTVPDSPLVLWRFKAGAAVSATPVVSGRHVFAVADDGVVYKINMKGEKVWAATLAPEESAATNATARVRKFATQPMCVGERVVVGSDQGSLHALDVSSGKATWSYLVGETINGSANWLEPEGERGTSVVVISQADAVVHRVALDTGKPVWTSASIARCDGSPGVGRDFVAFGSCDSALHVLSAGKGAVVWRIGLEGDGQVAGGVAVAGNLAFAGTRGGLAFCADAVKGCLVWTNEIARGEVFATPVVTSNRVVTASNDGHVVCLNRADGKLLWNVSLSGTPQSPVVAGETVVVTSGGTLYLLGLADGAKRWANKAGDHLSSPAVVDGSIFVGTDEGFVVMYGAGTKRF